MMELEEKYRILMSFAKVCTQEDELRNLLARKAEPICYDGFEPSGRMHIAQGVMKTLNVNKMIKAGCRVKILIADWFAMLNNKMGGDIEKIEVVGNYFIEIWKAAGMDLESGKVEFIWSSKEINTRAHEYWPLVMDIAKTNTECRIKRCCSIMGRHEQDKLSAAQMIYPLMQCADIFFLKADICQLGTDQDKVNMFGRDYCDASKRKIKPIILSHHMLPGFKEGQAKMSKSDPSSSIFMEDDEMSVREKIGKAYCPPGIVEDNPCLEYLKHIVFPWFNEFTVRCNPGYGGDKTFTSFEELVADYKRGDLHPDVLRPALANALNTILEPVRRHFAEDKNANDLLKKVKELMENQASAPPSEAVETISINDESQKPEPSSSSNTTPMMVLEKKYRTLRSIAAEGCILEDELLNLLVRKQEPICYDGFEPSGRMHIAQGLMKTLNVNKMTSAGCRVKIVVADWFAMLNNKMGGDMKKIEVVGKYLIETWKAAGMDLEGGKVEFIWSSKEINARAHEYWPLVMDIARNNSFDRIKRCSKIMGRNDQDELFGSHILYPLMQCADVFFLKADICQQGMDQMEVNELARDYWDASNITANKPIILPHHMLPGLKEGQAKMSTSDPDSSIFMDDDEATVNFKINKRTYCPPKIVLGNPCLEYLEYIVLPWFNEFTVQRTPEHGGDKKFTSFEELTADYECGDLHPQDMKIALAKALNKILEPVRRHFAEDKIAKDLLKQVKSYKVTK